MVTGKAVTGGAGNDEYVPAADDLALAAMADAAEAQLASLYQQAENASSSNGAEVAQSEDFDAFWSARTITPRPRLTNVLGSGLDLEAPEEVPLRFEILRRKLVASQRDQDVKLMVDVLYGAGTYDTLITHGVTTSQVALLLAWGAANTGASRMPLAEVKTALEQLEAAAGDGGKANARGVPSPKGGRSSKRTSRASTTSPKPS